jgi:hypothetical protein
VDVACAILPGIRQAECRMGFCLGLRLAGSTNCEEGDAGTRRRRKIREQAEEICRVREEMARKEQIIQIAMKVMLAPVAKTKPF